MRAGSIAAAAVALLLAPVDAGAAVLSLDGGIATTLPSNYGTEAGAPGPFGPGTPVRVFSAATAGTGGLWLSADTSVRFTFLGTAAAYDNVAIAGSALFTSKGATPGDAVTGRQAGGGYLDFVFGANGADGRKARNNGPIAAGLALAFLLQSPGSAVAFLDDGGAGPDRDFNDMVVGIQVVPLPAAGLLLIGGLAGLGLLARRRSRETSLATPGKSA